MESILLLAHIEADGKLAKPALEALTAALTLGGELTVGLVGGDAQAAADQIAGAGAVHILAVTGEAFTQPRYSTDAAAAEALCRAADTKIVLAPSTSRWSRALPGVAYRRGGRVDTHATSLAIQNGVPAVTRWFYRQRMEAVLTRQQRPWVVLLDAGCVPAWSGAAGSATVESIAVEMPPSRTVVTGIQAPKADEQTIRPDAKLLFVAGAGWTKKQAVLRFMTHLNQIGQTGSTPRHPKGLSTCCHGEEPHVVGWRFVTERRAINLDANCGWARGKADVLYVADAFEVMREVNRLME